MLADQLTKVVPGERLLQRAMSSEQSQVACHTDDTHSTLAVEILHNEEDEEQAVISGKIIVGFAVFGMLCALHFGVRFLMRLAGWCCRRREARPLNFADAIAQTDHEQNYAVPQQALRLSNVDDHPWFDETLVNTEDDTETIPAHDTELERLRRILSARMRGQAAGPVYLHGSSSASTER